MSTDITTFGGAKREEGQVRKTDLDLILLGDALGDSDDEGDLVVDRFDDCVCRCGRRDIDDGCVGLCLLYGLETLSLTFWYWNKSVTHLAHAAKDGQTKVGLTCFLGGDTANHICAIFKSLCDVERRLWTRASGPRRTMGVSCRRKHVCRWSGAPSFP